MDDGPQGSLKTQEEGKKSLTGSKVRVHEVFLIANPLSGSRQAAKFIKRYGTDQVHEVPVHQVVGKRVSQSDSKVES